jgi:sigma-B regulation protein RsbU (phosphoserine phosphatase)
MWASIFVVLLLILGGASAAVFCVQRREIARLRAARDKIQVEEKRVFEFLQGLGSAFRDDLHPGDLHRLIVEGAMKILDAHGGTIYATSRDGQALLPAYISKGCPPLVEVPEHIMAQLESTPQALQSYLRLHAVERGEGMVGQVWRDGEPLILNDGGPRLAALRDTSLHTESAMLAPLVYGNEQLGVLAVANGPMGVPFSDGDFVIFKAITEQSAFALYNAIIYSQAAAKRRLDTDLEVAKDIQRILLPSTAPDIGGYEINGINLAAQQVSGDYFDYIRIDDHRLGVAIADVSGKGVPASLIMAMCRSVLRSKAPGNDSSARVLSSVNRQLYPDIKEDMFISMAYLILNDQTDEVILGRAGHDAPVLYKSRDQSVTRINPPGMALGIDRGDVFDRVTRDFSQLLEQDDCLILYTDGVTEALDRKGMEFGMTRMMQAIQASAPEGAPGIIKRLTDDLRSFVGRNPQNDDITLIAIRRK